MLDFNKPAHAKSQLAGGGEDIERKRQIVMVEINFSGRRITILFCRCFYFRARH